MNWITKRFRKIVVKLIDRKLAKRRSIEAVKIRLAVNVGPNLENPFANSVAKVKKLKAR